MDAARPIIAL